MAQTLPIFFLLVVFCCGTLAAESGNTLPRQVPPPGIRIGAEDRKELEAGVAGLEKEIELLRVVLKDKSALLELLPDVQIYHKAVDWALRHDEFYRSNEVRIARQLLQKGLGRAESLRRGETPWTAATGLVVRGYVSRIDGSVQPYGLVVPASFQSEGKKPRRLDVWLHGRDDHLTELKFIDERERNSGEFTPDDTFVLHPYGRYCNAFKFAGEVDVFEGLEHARRNYPVDENRIAVRGFSMGGAGCWHLAAHHAGIWAAAAPGAGFSETAIYTKALSRIPKPPWFEQTLWHFCDAADYAPNLFNCPTIAYSGELDKQKQAAEVMAKAMKAEGIVLTHLIGPKTEHRYEPETKKELARRFDELTTQGRNPLPKKVRFSTWTLRYSEMFWVRVEGLDLHWQQARVEAEIVDPHRINVRTVNVTAFTLSMAVGLCPLAATPRPELRLNGQTLEAPDVAPDGSWKARFLKRGGRWSVVHSFDDGTLRKRPGLQGPIDDAFMDSFTIVRPTGKAFNETAGRWTEDEMMKAIVEWRNQFRGDAYVKDDTEITDAEIATSNLILWGDPSSNRLLARIAGKLPIQWSANEVRLGDKKFPSDAHVLVLIYPNPLNPNRYVVLNSGFTFAHPVSASNADQTPKLPDYAIVDLNGPASVGVAGEVVEAGFFDEQWRLVPETK